MNAISNLKIAGVSLLEVLVAFVVISAVGSSTLLLQLELAKTVQKQLEHYRAELTAHLGEP
jgi:Tfp pilus assembly protein PilV